MGRSYILTRQRPGPAWLCWGSLQRFPVISPSLTPLPPTTTTTFTIPVCLCVLPLGTVSNVFLKILIQENSS